mgnify:FL=1
MVTVREKQYKISGSWIYRIKYVAPRLGKGMTGGQVTSQEKGGFATKKEAQAALKAEIKQLESSKGKSVESKGQDFNWLVEQAENEFLFPAVYIKHSTDGRVLDGGYKSYASVRSQVRTLQTYFGRVPLEDIDLSAVLMFKRKRMTGPTAKGSKPKISTVNRDLACLRMLLEWGSKKGWCSNPFADALKTGYKGGPIINTDAEERRKNFVFSESDEERILAACVGTFEREYVRTRKGKTETIKASYTVNHLMLRAFIIVALDTGIRRGELTHVRWQDIDPSTHSVRIRAGFAKDGEERRTIITSRGLEALESIKDIAPAGGPFSQIGDIKRSWGTVRKTAGCPELTFHDLRGTFASRLVAAGVPMPIVRELMGHGAGNTTERHYIGLDDATLLDTVKRIEAWRRRYQIPGTIGDTVTLSAAVN